MENGETSVQGAARETWEEARTRVRVIGPYRLYDLPFVNQVYMMFRARLQTGDFEPGPESLDVRLFAAHEIPWDKLAFPVVKQTLDVCLFAAASRVAGGGCRGRRSWPSS